MFSHKMFQSGINICHIMFLQRVRIKSQPCSLTNVENSASNFSQSVQICFGESLFALYANAINIDTYEQMIIY